MDIQPNIACVREPSSIKNKNSFFSRSAGHITRVFLQCMSSAEYAGTSLLSLVGKSFFLIKDCLSCLSKKVFSLFCRVFCLPFFSTEKSASSRKETPVHKGNSLGENVQENSSRGVPPNTPKTPVHKQNPPGENAQTNGAEGVPPNFPNSPKTTGTFSQKIWSVLPTFRSAVSVTLRSSVRVMPAVLLVAGLHFYLYERQQQPEPTCLDVPFAEFRVLASEERSFSRVLPLFLSGLSCPALDAANLFFPIDGWYPKIHNETVAKNAISHKYLLWDRVNSSVQYHMLWKNGPSFCYFPEGDFYPKINSTGTTNSTKKYLFSKIPKLQSCTS